MSTAIERQRKYRARHLDRVRASARKYQKKAYFEDPEKFRQFSKEWYASHKEQNAKAVRKYRLKKNYQMTVEEFNDMLERQGGVCAICKGPPKGRFNTYNVDHNHKTGKVRGLLCFPCNVSIGNAMENTDILAKMILYINGGAI